jgi:hypothetical protein
MFGSIRQTGQHAPRLKMLRTGCGLARAYGLSRPTEIGNDQRF